MSDKTNGGPVYQAWAALVRSVGGSPNVWPFTDDGEYHGLYGKPAAKYNAQTYGELANARKIDLTLPQRSTRGNSEVYVLAPMDVQKDAPELISGVDKALNAVGTKVGETADALGLPSLDEIGKFLGKWKWYVGGAVLLLAVVYLAPSVLKASKKE